MISLSLHAKNEHDLSSFKTERIYSSSPSTEIGKPSAPNDKLSVSDPIFFEYSILANASSGAASFIIILSIYLPFSIILAVFSNKFPQLYLQFSPSKQALTAIFILNPFFINYISLSLSSVRIIVK